MSQALDTPSLRDAVLFGFDNPTQGSLFQGRQLDATCALPIRRPWSKRVSLLRLLLVIGLLQKVACLQPSSHMTHLQSALKSFFWKKIPCTVATTRTPPPHILDISAAAFSTRYANSHLGIINHDYYTDLESGIFVA